jgi:hypothetical protein
METESMEESIEIGTTNYISPNSSIAAKLKSFKN